MHILRLITNQCVLRCRFAYVLALLAEDCHKVCISNFKLFSNLFFNKKYSKKSELQVVSYIKRNFLLPLSFVDPDRDKGRQKFY